MDERPIEPGPAAHTTPKPAQSFAVPIAILLAGGLIAGAVLIGQQSAPAAPVAGTQRTPTAEDTAQQLDNLEPITSDDHIRGNPDAPIKIVEFSDTECPFCKRFHETMRQVMDTYGDSGEVAWIYRHFPIDQLHSKARKEGEALECAGAQGGNDAFWKYADRLFEITPSNDQLDLAELPRIADYIGIDVATFNECLESGRFAEHIASDLENATATGGRGTPWSIFIGPDGTKLPINGAQPLQMITQLIETSLKGP